MFLERARIFNEVQEQKLTIWGLYNPISTPETSLGKSTEYKEANIICGDLPDYVCMKPRRTSEEQEPVESPAEC